MKQFSSLVAALALWTFACSDAQSGGAGTLPTDPAAVQEGTVQEGEFVTYVADYEDGHSERYHALRQSDGRELRVSFDAPVGLVTGSRVRLRGATMAEGFRVSDYELLSSPPTSTQTVESTPPTYEAPPSPDSYALVMVDLGTGVDIDAGTAQRNVFSTTAADKSFASYYYESSHGKYTITGAVVGPFAYSMTTCNTTGMFQTIEAANTAALAPYKHLIYYFARTSLCTFGGLGEEGSQSMPAKRTWINGSQNGNIGCTVLMQEPGHNLGLMHANTMTCGSASFSTTPMTSCTITEYGNTLTTMGSFCRQNNGYEKWYEQWLTGCNGVRVTSSGTFNVVPLGDSCPGAVQVLQIPMPATLTVNDPQATTTTVNLKNYYVELRTAVGSFDAYTTAGRGGGIGGGVTFAGPTVTVYVSDDVRTGVSTGRGGGGTNSVWTELLNMSPGATPFTGLTTSGQSFSDPAGGPTITLQSISATGAVIGVTVPNGTGGPTCIDGTTLTGSGGACDGGVVVIPPFDAGPIEAGVGSADASLADASGGGVSDARAVGEGGSSGAGTAAGSEAGSGPGGGSGSSGGGGPSAGAGGSSVGDAGGSGSGSGQSAGSSTSSSGAPTWGGGAPASSGCGCAAAGASPEGPRGTWIAIGALGFVGWASQRRRRKAARG
jgi:MYXO-CTERM domain-containing protein